MAIERLTAPVLPVAIPDRVVREQTGQGVPIPPVGTVQGEQANFNLPPSLPGSVGAIIDGPDGLALQPGTLTGLAQGQQQTQAANAADQAAMRPDQLLMSRQLIWQRPDPATLAGSWHVMVRTYGEQRARLMAQAAGQHVPASLFMADTVPIALRDGGRAAPQIVSELDAWRFAVYAWGSEKLVLRVVSRDPGQQDEPRRRRPRVALRLEMNLPEFGKVIVQMEPAGEGVVLEICTQQNAAMQHIRELLPQLAAIVSRCGLSIVRCRLMRELAPVRPESQPTRTQTAMLTPAVFKSMAEIAVLLSQPQPPHDLFSESA